MELRKIDAEIYAEITNDLVDGTLATKVGECSGKTLYSYDDLKWWFSTPLSAYLAKQPGADPAAMWRQEIMAEFKNCGVPQLVI